MDAVIAAETFRLCAKVRRLSQKSRTLFLLLSASSPAETQDAFFYVGTGLLQNRFFPSNPYPNPLASSVAGSDPAVFAADEEEARVGQRCDLRVASALSC